MTTYTPAIRIPVALSLDEIDVLIMSLELAKKSLQGEAHKVVLAELQIRLNKERCKTQPHPSDHELAERFRDHQRHVNSGAEVFGSDEFTGDR